MNISEHLSQLPQLSSTLSNDEWKRVDRYVRLKDASQFSIIRGLLRWLLGHYLGEAPDRLTFNYGKFGKPSLDTGSSKAMISFNVSHSKDMALIAFAIDTELGVDIEYIGQPIDYEKIATRFFSASETKALLRTDINQKLSMFYRLWTCKESFVKAVGTGLAMPFDYFDVCLSSDETISLSSLGNQTETAGWSIAEVKPANDYAAALAVRASVYHLRLWSLPTNWA